MIQCIESLTRYSLRHSVAEKKAAGVYELHVELERTSAGAGKEFRSGYVLIVSNASGEDGKSILLECKIIKEKASDRVQVVTVTIPGCTTGRLDIALLCERFVGLDSFASVPDLEEAVGKPCACKRKQDDLDPAEVDELLGQSPEEAKANNQGKKRAGKCRHRCKNKQLCKHLCCKIDLAAGEAGKEPQTKTAPAGEYTQTTLSAQTKLWKAQRPQNNVMERLSQFQAEQSAREEHGSLTSEELAEVAQREIADPEEAAAPTEESGFFESLVQATGGGGEKEAPAIQFAPSLVLMQKPRLAEGGAELDQESIERLLSQRDEPEELTASSAPPEGAKRDWTVCGEFPEYFT